MTVCVVTLLLAALTFGRDVACQQLRHQQGVTKDSIKVGIPLIDFDAIKDFVDYTSATPRRSARSSSTDINKNGGIDGRKIVPVYKKYPPIPGGKPDPLSLCTALAEDDKVFAVLGVFIDFTGQGQLCLTKEHKVIHIGHELDQPWIDASPGGLMLTPDPTKEDVAAALVNLLWRAPASSRARRSASLGDKNNERRVNDVIVPALKKAKVEDGLDRHPQHHRHRHHRGAGAGRQLHREVEERGRQHGLPRPATTSRRSSSPSRSRRRLPKAQLVTDTDTTLDQAKGEQKAGVEARTRTRA